jgi:hypothetical protein
MRENARATDAAKEGHNAQCSMADAQKARLNVEHRALSIAQ